MTLARRYSALNTIPKEAVMPTGPARGVGMPIVGGALKGLSNPVGDSGATQEPQMIRQLNIYGVNLDELEAQISRIRCFSDRLDGPVPPSETEKPLAAPAEHSLARLEALNYRLRDAINTLNEEANRLEGIG